VSRDRFLSAFDGFCLPALRLAEAIEERFEEGFFSPPEEVDQRPWSRHRVVLIGGAAHAMAPTMAQGAALALEVDARIATARRSIHR
jgi:2-polyprenyl-6-methoxyphenol hydroxylase-like FAD-dependent oxidoreductase